MIELDRNMIINIVNMASKYKFGHELIVNGKLDPSILGEVAHKFINNDKINIEMRQDDDLFEDESSIEFENDKIIISNSAQVYVSNVVNFIISEFDIISTSLNNIYTGQYNDRIAKIISAEKKYRQACETKDENFRIETLKNAESLIINGMTELELQIKTDVNRIDAIPKNFIQKLYKPKMKLEEVDDVIKKTREALVYYTKAIALMNIIDSEFGEINRLHRTLSDSKQFLQNTLTVEKRNRLNGFDVKKDNFMIKKVDEIFAYIDSIEQGTSAKSQVYLLEV